MTDSHFMYFAYGSNMLTERLTARCSGAVAIGKAYAKDREIAYCLNGGDGSAKAGILTASGKVAWGVLFEIPMHEQVILDGFEGAPLIYTREPIAVIDATGVEVSALTYVPRDAHIMPPGAPYDWYQALCLGGAVQHGLPEAARLPLAGTVGEVAADFATIAETGRDIALTALEAAGFSLQSVFTSGE